MKNTRKFFLRLGTTLSILLIVVIFIDKSFIGTVVTKVYIFDVGQGDSILIRTAGGQNILLDGGPDKKVLKKIGRVLPFWDRQIDYLILSHPHDDHLLGLIEVLRRYQVKNIVRTTADAGTAVDKIFLNDIKTREIIISDNKSLSLQDNCRLDILYPSSLMLSVSSQADLNNTSLVAKLVCPFLSVLLTGDSGQAIEKELLANGFDLQADVIKIAHHGSETASSPEYLRAVGAKVALISVGLNNKYKHPSARIITRLEDLGINTYRTDRDGDLEILANNKGYIVLKEALK